MKNIWIFNHYAGPPSICSGTRHFNFAKYLMKKGYEVTIFASSAQHNSDINLIIDNRSYMEYEEEKVRFVYIKTRQYETNGKKRLGNMLDYYHGLFKITDKFKKPDVIIGSSVHPLACLAALKLSKKYHCKNIVEIRDLWPESIIAYGKLKRNSVIAKLLYKGEKYIYRKADAIVMTWEGGSEYIKNHEWQDAINLDKVFHICNGVDINSFDKQCNEEILLDNDLENDKYIKIIYAGSIREVNNLKMIIEASEELNKRGNKNYRFIIFGDGDQRLDLENYCEVNNIDNVIFKGKVEKKYIPSILKRADICLLHNKSTSLDKYGQSQNKLFEYMASGSAVFQTYKTNFSICEKYECGVMLKEQSSLNIMNEIENMCQDKEYLKKMGSNGLKASKDYDFENLTNKLIKIIEGL